MPKIIAFRTDASLQIGTGHVMRCLSLADELRERGACCLFICRPHDGHLLELIVERGHRVVALPALTARLEDVAGVSAHALWLGTDQATDSVDTRLALGPHLVDWVVVDHYALDIRWESALRSSCRRLMVIDDLANRRHDCDLLLDQNLGRTEVDYRALLSPHTLTLIGPGYALLRAEFARIRTASLLRRVHPEVKRMLITLGGVDEHNVTCCVLDALRHCHLPAGLAITIVMGPHAPWLHEVRARASAMLRPTTVLAGVANMAELMFESDLAIGAAGSTAWERCCLGLPTLQLVLADNQQQAAAALVALGAVDQISSAIALVKELPILLKQLDSVRLQELSERAARVCDGRGTPLIADELLKEADIFKAHK